jgi:hypothetical protein
MDLHCNSAQANVDGHFTCEAGTISTAMGILAFEHA